MAKVFTNLGEAAAESMATGGTVFTASHRGKEFFAVAESVEEAKGEIIEVVFGLEVGVVQTGLVLKAYRDFQSGVDVPSIPEAPPKKAKAKKEKAEAEKTPS